MSCRVKLMPISNDETSITELYYTYPMSMIVSKSHEKNHKIIYFSSFGGGLLSGDKIQITIEVGPHCKLSIYNPSSTKIYKKNLPQLSSMQDLNITIQNEGLLIYWPEPITCFENSSYCQNQIINLAKNSSLIFLDWMTCGRGLNEFWTLAKFYSDTCIYFEDKLYLKERRLYGLENDPTFPIKMGQFSCIAFLFIIGPLTRDYQARILRYKQEDVNIKWGVSLLEEEGLLLKAACTRTETLDRFLRDFIRPLL